MSRKIHPIHPSAQRAVRDLGERLRLARLRRRISLSEMAERVGVSRDTLRRLETGETTTSLAVLVRALTILGLQGDLDLVAKDDELGRRIQDSSLRPPRRRRSAS